MPYSAIPGFPAGNVSGHAKELVAGRLSGKRVVAYNGRSHYTSAATARDAHPVATLVGLGCRQALFTPTPPARCTRSWGRAACR